MSDSESTTAAPPPEHPQVGGKSLQSLERPRYRSWRKKYRKLRHRFEATLDENKRLFKEEHKLEGIAKRLREELDGLLELCLDLNQNPAIPPELRFDISYPEHPRSVAENAVPVDVTPDEANQQLAAYTRAVRSGQMPHLDLHVIREQVEERLAAQGVETLVEMETRVPQPISNAADAATAVHFPTDDGDGVVEHLSWLTAEQEDAYLARLDAKLATEHYNLTPGPEKIRERDAQGEKHWAELTPRGFETMLELANPQSQHNWLKTHQKVNTNIGGDDDADSVASHEVGGSKPSRRRTANKDKNLAKQVGDRAVERARMSPGAADGLEEDELAIDDGSSVSKKRVKDPDSTFRVKGGKGGSSGNKAKRKRSGEDVGGAAGSGTSIKKPKVEGE